MAEKKRALGASPIHGQPSKALNPLDIVPKQIPFDVPYGTPISLECAQCAINAAVAEAKQRDWKMNVAVVDWRLLMYFHGGGWILGSKNTHDKLVRDLVNGSDAAFVFVNYTPSPEAQFSIPFEQCYAATKYVSENGKKLGLDSSRLALAGDSLGGYTTAVVAQLAKRAKWPVHSLPSVDVPGY